MPAPVGASLSTALREQLGLKQGLTLAGGRGILATMRYWTAWVLLIFGLLAAETLCAQSDATAPVFDLVAIRPTDPSTPRNNCYMKGQPGGQTFTGRCVSLKVMIRYAYKIVDSQIAGAPEWAESALFDFEAKADRSVTRAEVGAMFQAMIVERFHLKFHREARTMAAFVLSVDKGGNKMTRNTSDYEWEIPITNVPGTAPTFKGTRCPLYYLSWWIGQAQNRPVVDKTGLDGFWDFRLEFVPDGMRERRGPGGDAIAAPDGPSLSTALREQLGLKLEAEKTPVDVYVIDHVQKPDGN